MVKFERYPFNQYYPITQHFGANPEFYSKLMVGGVPLEGHEGVDWGMVVDTPIFAVAPGTVLKAEYQEIYGNVISIQHEGGFSTVYAHLSEMFVKPGDRIGSEVIAASGNTGRYSSGPHLHFGLRIDPWYYGNGWAGCSNPEPFFLALQSTEEEKNVFSPYVLSSFQQLQATIYKLKPQWVMLHDDQATLQNLTAIHLQL